MTNFGDLRALVHGRRTPKAWARLVSMIDRWPDRGELQAQVLPYLEAHLEAWPDHVRRMPRSWIGDHLGGRARRELRLVRALNVEHVFCRASMHTGPVTIEAVAEQLVRTLRDDAVGPLAEIDLGVLHLNLPSALLQRVMAALVDAPAMRQLRRLTWNRDHIHDDVLLDLGQAPWAQGLRALILGLQRISGDAVAQGRWQRLEELNLCSSSLNAVGIDAITRRLDLGALHTLKISHTGVDLDSLVDILEHSPALTTLFVSSDTSLRGLDARLATHLARLRHLQMRSSYVFYTEGNLRALVGMLRDIEVLDLNFNMLRDGDVAALAEALPSLPHLHTLRIASRSDYGSQAVIDLIHQPAFRRIRELHFGSHRLDDRVLEGLAACPYVDRLRDIHLDQSYHAHRSIRGFGLNAVDDSPWLSNRVKGTLRASLRRLRHQAPQ